MPAIDTAAWNRSVRLLAVGHAYGDFQKRSEASPGPAANLAARAEELAALEAPSAAALEAVQARRSRDLRWLDLPYQHEVHDRVLAYADEVAGRFRNVVVLGIGGSALGTIALQGALNSPYHNLGAGDPLPRLFVLDNVDPEDRGTHYGLNGGVFVPFPQDHGAWPGDRLSPVG